MRQSVLLDEDLWSDCKGKEFHWDNNGDIIREIWPERMSVTFINKKGEEVQISLMDLWDIWNLDEDEIKFMLQSILWISIESSEWINLINRLAQKSFNYLRDELLYTEKELKWVGNINFSTTSWIIKFFKDTKHSQGIKKCMLAKVWMLLQEWVWFDVEQKRQKTMDVFDNKVVKSLEDIAQGTSFTRTGWKLSSFKREWKADFKWSFHIDNMVWKNKRKIEFNVEIREKTIESSVSKALRYKDYANQWDILDLLWIRITAKNDEEALIISNFLSQLVFKYWDYRIKNKGLVVQWDLDRILWESEYFVNNEGTSSFIQKLEESFSQVEYRESSALGYKDLRLVPSWEWNKLSFEIMVYVEGNDKTKWLAHHKVFTYTRKLAERIRLEWYIDLDGIKRISNVLVDDLIACNKSNLWWKSPIELMREMLDDIYIETRGDFWIAYKPSKSLNKVSLGLQLKKDLPSYYASQRLSPFYDSQWRSSRRKKYTNKIGKENISVFDEDIYLDAA